MFVFAGGRQPGGCALVDELGQEWRDPGRRRRGDGQWGDRFNRAPHPASVVGLVLGEQPAQHLAGAFVHEVDLGKIPAGVADLDAREVSVAVWDLEAVPLDHDGAVAFALRATVGLGEGEPQRRTVRTRPRHVGAGHEARNRCFLNLGVELAIILVLRPRQGRLVEKR
jgi:hypothetical protein